MKDDDEEYEEIEKDPQVVAIEDRNKQIRNSLKNCQNTFVGHRFGTNFFDIGEITFNTRTVSGYNEKQQIALVLELQNELKRNRVVLENFEKRVNYLTAENENLRKRIEELEEKEENVKKRKNNDNDSQLAKKRRIE